MPALDRLALRTLAGLYALAIAAVPALALAQSTPRDAPVAPTPDAGDRGGIPWFLILVVALAVVWFVSRRGGRRTTAPPRVP